MSWYTDPATDTRPSCTSPLSRMSKVVESTPLMREGGGGSVDRLRGPSSGKAVGHYKGEGR
jgi:hypothetical protein